MAIIMKSAALNVFGHFSKCSNPVESTSLHTNHLTGSEVVWAQRQRPLHVLCMFHKPITACSTCSRGSLGLIRNVYLNLWIKTKNTGLQKPIES